MSDAIIPHKGNEPIGGTQQGRELLRPADKAAIVLSLLEPDRARALAEQFDDGRIDRAIEAFESLGMVDREALIATIRDFNERLSSEVPLVAGGKKRAKALAASLHPPAEAVPALPGPAAEETGSLEPGASAEDVWAYLRALDAASLVRLLRHERPALIAAVLPRMKESASAAVIAAIPEDAASDVVRLMMIGNRPGRRTYEAIAESLRRSAPERIAANDSDSRDTTGQTALILNALSPGRQTAILDLLAQSDPGVAAQLAPKVLRFSTLAQRLPKSAVPTLFREIDEPVIDRALKHALDHQPETAEFLLSCISRRLSEMIRDRLEEAPPVKPQEAEEAQSAIMRTLIAWEAEERFRFKDLPEAAERSA